MSCSSFSYNPQLLHWSPDDEAVRCQGEGHSIIWLYFNQLASLSLGGDLHKNCFRHTDFFLFMSSSPNPGFSISSLFPWNPDLCWLCYVFVFIFPYSSWNQVLEFSPAKSLLLESKPLLRRRFWTVFPHAYSSARARPMRGSCLYPRCGNLVEFLEWKPVNVRLPPQ